MSLRADASTMFIVIIYLSLPSAKSEIQSKKSETNETLKSKIKRIKFRDELVWNFALFDHLDLFRISDFAFRIYN